MFGCSLAFAGVSCTRYSYLRLSLSFLMSPWQSVRSAVGCFPFARCMSRMRRRRRRQRGWGLGVVSVPHPGKSERWWSQFIHLQPHSGSSTRLHPTPPQLPTRQQVLNVHASVCRRTSFVACSTLWLPTVTLPLLTRAFIYFFFFFPPAVHSLFSCS